uniref:SGNH hydrolase-type esterase domain-containing protein n=1 Tax=Pogona vitticeps TaxID=103695 RepID=A0ABM5FV92_9SAUR
MAAHKGQGTTQRGKQHARKHPVPELSPPQSSSNEESWPIWQKLQQRMDALGGARAGQAPAAQGGRQPRRSTRDARGHRRAKLRALAQDIHNKLVVLEAELQTDDASEDATAPSEWSTETEVPTASESEASSAAARGSNGAPGGGNIVETPTLQGSGAPQVRRRSHIIIIGHSFVFWAERYAATSPWGSNLGLDDRALVEWKGSRGMLWSQLCRAAAFARQPPDMLLIHLGGNDLAQYPGKALIIDVVRDLSCLRRTYAEMRLVWSTIIPRRIWKRARHFWSVNKAQRSINREVGRAVCGSLGQVIGHHRIRLDRPELYRPDGVHLSERGLDVFLEDVKGGLLCELQQLEGEHGK